MTYYRLGNYDTSDNHMKEAYQLLIPFLLVTLSHNGSAACVELILWKIQRLILQADEVVSLAWMSKESALPCPMTLYTERVCCGSGSL